MNQTFLLLTKDPSFQELFSDLLSYFNVHIIKELTETQPDKALIDHDQIEEMRQKLPNCLLITRCEGDFTFAAISALQQRAAPAILLPKDLTVPEATAVVRTLCHVRSNGESLPVPLSEELLEKYRASVTKKIEAIEGYISRIDALPPEDLVILRTEVHKIAGSGASYGFKELGAVCREWDIYLTPLLDPNPQPVPADFPEESKSFFRKMLLGYQKIDILEAQKPTFAPPRKEGHRQPKEETYQSSVYLISPDPLVQRLFSTYSATQHLKLLGETNPHQALDNLSSGKVLPKCIILEKDYPLHRLTFENFLSIFPEGKSPLIGIIVSQESLKTAIELRNKNISFFFSKPISENEVQRFFNSLTQNPEKENLKALIVDDDPDAIEVLAKALEMLSIKSEAISDERELLEALQRHRPDILFLDLGLQTYSGYELLKALRSDMRYQELQIFIYTGLPPDEARSNAGQLGADDILFKPLDFNILKSKLAISRRRSRLFQSLDPGELRGLLPPERLNRAAESLLRMSADGVRLALIIIHIKNLSILKRTYGEETIKKILKGLTIELKFSFPTTLLQGLLSEELITIVVEGKSSGELEFQFDSLLKNFLQEVQVYTPVETPILLYAGGCLFEKSQEANYQDLLTMAHRALQEAETHPGPTITLKHPSGDPSTVSKAPLVVIVDDDQDLLALMDEAFRREGFEVLTFKTGQEGVDYFLRLSTVEKKMVLVLDRVLPDMDGIDVLRAVNLKFPAQVRALFLSSLTSEADVFRGFHEGAVDYIAKPFNINILIKKVQALLHL